MNAPYFAQELERLKATANFAATAAREAQQRAHGTERQVELINQSLTQLTQVMSATSRVGGSNADPGVQRVENIPGRRVPFDLVTEIQINANDTSVRTGTATISQEGPFVAVARAATFLSDFSFQAGVAESAPRLLGRSNGRFRPIHSAADISDALLPADVQRVIAFPGNGAPSYSSPALHSPFRTMEFDARVKMINQGTSFPRSNIPVPTPFWTTFINSPWQLGALDFFARADVIQFEVQPQHTNNPAAGNLAGFGATGVFPFIDAQYDHHEGIDDTEDPNAQQGDPDPVTRLPQGVFIILLHGFRIIQPPGAVVNLSAV